jgi:hypothetical protein
MFFIDILLAVKLATHPFSNSILAFANGHAWKQEKHFGAISIDN